MIPISRSNSLRKLIRLARPQFLIAGLFLFVFGACWAILLGAPFSLARLVLGYLVFMPAHLSISFSNDYFDVEADRHGEPTFFSGGTRILVDHPELRNPAKRIAVILILCSLLFGLFFQIVYSPPIWFMGLVILGNLTGWFYSAPPLRLAYHGLGELAMIFSIGLLIPALGYLVTSGHIDKDGMLFTVPLMLYGLAFILSVENPDMEADRLGKKMTWVARRGRSFGFSVTGAALLLATLFFLCIPWLTSRTYPLNFRFLGALSLLPLGAGCIGWLKRPLVKEPAARIVFWILLSYAVFCLLADGYLIFLILNRS
jgi:1,4-dihydroxy-2-naphthoate octaprenyltransferase